MTGLNLPVGNVVDRVGDARVDGLLGLSWGSNALSYSDPNLGSDYGPGYPVRLTCFSQLSSGRIAAVQSALDTAGPIGSSVRTGQSFSVEAFTNSVEAFTDASLSYVGGRRPRTGSTSRRSTPTPRWQGTRPSRSAARAPAGSIS